MYLTTSIAFIAVAVILPVTAVNVTFYEECSKTGKIQTLDMEECSANPCIVRRGKQFRLEVDFESNVDTDTLTADVVGIIAGNPLPWADVEKDACLSTTCPLKSGSIYNYTYDINVLSGYPTIPATVLYKLKASNGDDVVCFQLPVKIV